MKFSNVSRFMFFLLLSGSLTFIRGAVPFRAAFAQSDMALVEQEILDYLKKHYQEAERLYRSGALENALIEFQKVSDIDPGYEKVGQYMADIKKVILTGSAPITSPRPLTPIPSGVKSVPSMAVEADEVNVRTNEINIYAEGIRDKRMVSEPDVTDESAKRIAQDFVQEEIARQKQQERDKKAAQKDEQRRAKESEKKRIAEEKAAKKKSEQIADSLARGKKYFDDRNLDSAGKEFNRVLALDPDNAEARKFVDNLQENTNRQGQFKKAEQLFAEQKYDLSLAAFESILKEDPGNAGAREYVRKIHNAKTQQAQSARRETIEHLLAEGKELYGAGQYDMAIQIWDDALDMNPDPDLSDNLMSWKSKAELAKSDSESVILEETGFASNETRITDVARSSVPTTEFTPGWAKGGGTKKPLQTSLYISPDKQKLLDALAVRYSVEFNNASLEAVIETLTALTGLNIVVDTAAISQNVGALPEVLQGGAITLKVKDLPLIELMDAVLRFTNLAYSIEENMIWITSRDQILKNGLQLVVFDVSDLVRKMHDFPSEGLEGISTSAGSAESGGSSE